MDDGLFEEPARQPLSIGDKVVLRTIWGEEPCTVHELGTVDGWPMVTVKTKSGDTVTVSRANVREMP